MFCTECHRKNICEQRFHLILFNFIHFADEQFWFCSCLEFQTPVKKFYFGILKFLSETADFQYHTYLITELARIWCLQWWYWQIFFQLSNDIYYWMGLGCLIIEVILIFLNSLHQLRYTNNKNCHKKTFVYKIYSCISKVFVNLVDVV